MTWYEDAQEAERRADWETAITLVSAHAVCFSADHYEHSHHLWHMDLLVLADRLAELEALAPKDAHARRRLNRALRDRGLETPLRARAEAGDRDALNVLVRMLCKAGRVGQARAVVDGMASDYGYAHEVVSAYESGEPGDLGEPGEPGC
ncbi:hypothetical protein ACIBI4_12755 [Streptomyces sp. NPDC050418]|uniref:hypothetical protein n=1 Tax=Streptomyces sp. NPDC050418 TaxID=3365612 RepID=UPI0037AA6827